MVSSHSDAPPAERETSGSPLKEGVMQRERVAFSHWHLPSTTENVDEDFEVSADSDCLSTPQGGINFASFQNPDSFEEQQGSPKDQQ